MSPQDLANRHDQISDIQAEAMQKTIQSLLQPALNEARALLDQLTVDDKGKIERTPGNRLLIRKIVSLFAKKKKQIREEAWNNFAEGEKLIKLNIDGYITWQKNQIGQ